MTTNFYKVLEYLREYAGQQYKKIDKCRDENEQQYMVAAGECGREARQIFTDIAEYIEEENDLLSGRITQWQNSGTFVSYFWTQLKRPHYEDSNISLSLFAEKADNDYRFRLSIELAVEKATEEERKQYRKLLEIPLEENLVYVAGGNNDGKFEVLEERDYKVVQQLNYKKVQVSYIFPEGILGDDFQNVLGQKVCVLLKYYDYVLGNNEMLDFKGVFVEDKEEGEEQLSTKEILQHINAYIAAKGFTFDDGLVENYYLSLKSKPFVILAGTSGTGKTRLVRLFAEAIGATSENGRYKLVSVRPDWSDSSDLFGHVDLNGKFIPGAIIDFIKKAELDNSNPYFLCLDEMNLARVEYYLSDILSVIETRELKDGQVVTDPLLSANAYGTDKDAAGKYGTLRIPENLYIIGTVNMDETTFPFSRKVLDRANTIEFSTVDFLSGFNSTTVEVKPLNLGNDFMKAEYVFFKQCESEKDFTDKLCIELQETNKILEKANAHVGYRVRDEIAFYMLNNKKAGLLSEDEAFDNEIMQKILPRIQGSSAAVKNMLCELFKHCAGEYESYQTESDDISSKMFKAAQKTDCKYRKSAEKIAYMVRRFEEDGFTAYWL